MTAKVGEVEDNIREGIRIQMGNYLVGCVWSVIVKNIFKFNSNMDI